MRSAFIILTFLLAIICVDGFAMDKSSSIDQVRSDGSKRLYLFGIIKMK